MSNPISKELFAEFSKHFSEYKAPAEPVRPWVGLTVEERDGKRVLENGLLFNTAEAQVWEIAVEWAEQKLKEKNT